jgi:recombinational DNA repair protein RecR
MKREDLRKMLEELQKAEKNSLEQAFLNLLICLPKDQGNIDRLAELTQDVRDKRKGCHVCKYLNRCPVIIRDNPGVCPVRGIEPDQANESLDKSGLDFCSAIHRN